VGIFAYKVPVRYGAAAFLHVHLEYDWRIGLTAGTGAFSTEAEGSTPFRMSSSHGGQSNFSLHRHLIDRYTKYKIAKIKIVLGGKIAMTQNRHAYICKVSRLYSAHFLKRSLLASAATLSVAALESHPASAFPITTSNPNLSITLDSTVEVNVLGRTENSSPDSFNNPNGDDVAQNFKHGLAAARVDLDTGLDVKYQNFGLRISGAAWEDVVYDEPNSNSSPGTINYLTNNQTSFSHAAHGLAGHRIEFDDVFTYGSIPIGSSTFSYRVGQFVQIYGQSLLLAAEGIGGVMNPIDGIRAQILLNPQSRDIFMPTPQISFEDQLSNGLAISGYYKLGWRQTRIPPAGTYFSPTDVIDGGADRVYVGGGAYFGGRENDIRPNGGDKQFGLQIQDSFFNDDFALHFVNYDAFAPEVYLHPGVGYNPATGQVGTYQLAYPRDAQLFGASYSASPTFGSYPVNFGVEVSERHHEGLTSGGSVAPLTGSDQSHVYYPVGDVAHFLVSFIYASPPLPMIKSDQASVTAEFGATKLLSVFENKANLYQKTGGLAVDGTIDLGLSYFDIYPSIDMAPALGISYAPLGNSPEGNFVHGGGSISLADTFTMNKVYNLTVQYRHYIGSLKTTLGGQSDPSQTLYGKDFVGLEADTSF
jgi:hypothetical protein